MARTFIVRLPARLAKDFKAKAHSAGTTPSVVLRRMVTKYVKAPRPPKRNAVQEHILMYSGRWNGYCSGVELLRKTRP